MLGNVVKLILLIILLVENSTSFHETLQRFSQQKPVKIGTIFQCASKAARIKMLKSTTQLQLRYLIADLTQDYNLTTFNNYFTRRQNHFGIVLDFSCPKTKDFVEKIPAKFFFETYHWLIINQTAEDLSKTFENVNFNINCDVWFLSQSDKNIYDVYNPASQKGGHVVVEKKGHFDLNLVSKENKYWLRKNMTGVTFKTAVVIPNLKGDLNEYLQSDENRKIDSMHRFQFVTVEYCRDTYNFSLEVQRTDSWGYIQPNGRFNGLVSLLEHNLVDFGGSPLIYKFDRMPVVDYSYGNWILRSTFIYRRPKTIAKSIEIFLRPLSSNVWITIVLFMSVILLALKITFYSEKKAFLGVKSELDSSWSFLFLFTLGAFCQQGATCYPLNISSRILSVFVFFFCILIYQFYSASIVSYLLMDPPRTINNLKDLVESQLDVGIEDILIDRDYFVQTTDPNARKLYETKIKKNNSSSSGWFSPEEGLSLVQKGNFAFHVETSTAYPIIEETYTNEEICDLEEVQMYRTQPMHANLPKNSPFREMMNYCMVKLLENGNLYRLRSHWDARKPACIESAKKIEIHVSLKEFLAGPIVLSYGITISMIFLILEFVLYYKWAPKWLGKKLSKIFDVQPKNTATETIVKPFTN